MGPLIMKSGIKVFDNATGRYFYFDPRYRCASNPTHIHKPPYFTDTTAFSKIEILSDKRPGDVVYIEWFYDKFLVLDEVTQEFVAGSTVWRLSRIMEYDKDHDSL